jgi:hypothetical protein
MGYFFKTKHMDMEDSLKIKIHTFYGDNSYIVAFRQIKFETDKYHGHTYKFYPNHYFV